MKNIPVEQKGFILASVLASYMFLKENSQDRDAIIQIIQRVGTLDKVRQRLLEDKAFAHVPDQSILFDKAIGLLNEICKNKDQGIEAQLFSLIRSVSKDVSKSIKKSAFSLAMQVALEDENISPEEQNFLNQVDNLLGIGGKMPSIRTNMTSMISRTIGSTISAIPLKIKIVSILVLIGIAAFLYLRSSDTFTYIKATFKGYEKIDKLYTTFTVVPLIKKSYSGGLMSQAEDTVAFWTGRQMKENSRINGYIVSDYEMAIGYNEVNKIIGEYIGKTCPSNIDSLPAPQILSIKANVYPPQGGGASVQHLMYVTPERKAIIRAALIAEMKNTGQWDKIVIRGRDVLNAYISLYCGEK